MCPWRRRPLWRFPQPKVCRFCIGGCDAQGVLCILTTRGTTSLGCFTDCGRGGRSVGTGAKTVPLTAHVSLAFEILGCIALRCGSTGNSIVEADVTREALADSSSQVCNAMVRYGMAWYGIKLVKGVCMCMCVSMNVCPPVCLFVRMYVYVLVCILYVCYNAMTPCTEMFSMH